MDKLKLCTFDLTDENTKKIGDLFPNCVTESRDDKGNIKKSIDFDLLRQELSKNIVEGPQERYTLNWPGKREALLTANAPIAKTLRPCRKESVDFDTTKNIFIEGDNLNALKLMQETYLGKIKMIYIDPPYNTGNDFIYEDDFAESFEEFLKKSNQKDEEGKRLVANIESNGRFHSDWLSMMYPRLKLARNLLKDDGAIFISIDDTELDNLKKLCNEIFGEKNYIGCISRATGTTTGQDAQKIGSSLDYLLLYCKSEYFMLKGLPLEENDEARFSSEDEKGKYSMLQLRKTGNADRKEDRPLMHYPIKSPDGKDVYPIGPTGYESRWRVGENRYHELLNENLIVWKESRNGTLAPYVKYYLEGRTKQVSNLWTEIDGNKKGSIELKNLLDVKAFDNPKPTQIIAKMMQISADKEDIILDFFAGSCSTAQAVLEYNTQNKTKHNFILVQIHEKCEENTVAFKAGFKTIADIGKERIRRAGKKIKKENATTTSNLDIGFRVLKVDSSNMQDVYYNPDAYSQDSLFEMADNIKTDRSDEDLLFQVLLDWGVDLSLRITKEKIAGNDVFFVSKNALAVCFAQKGEITEDFCKKLAKREPLRVVFRDSGFKDDSMKINVEQIFKLMSPHTEVKTI